MYLIDWLKIYTDQIKKKKQYGLIKNFALTKIVRPFWF